MTPAPMTPPKRLRPLSRPACAQTDPWRLFILDAAIAVLNFIGRVKF